MRRRATGAVLGASLAGAMLAVACSLLPPDYTVHVSNSTTLPLTIVVNGSPIAVIAPSAQHDYPPAALPAMPWTVEARLGSGRALASIVVRPDSIQDDRAPDGTGAYSSVGDIEILSCGQVWIWVGEPGSGGPARQGTPGDCDP